jgi:hypothetical protein
MTKAPNQDAIDNQYIIIDADLKMLTYKVDQMNVLPLPDSIMQKIIETDIQKLFDALGVMSKRFKNCQKTEE